MNMLWSFFEISINLFQGFIMVYFASKYLDGKFGKGYLTNHGALFSVILAVLITVMNYITSFEHFLALIYILPIFAFSQLCLNGSIQKKIFTSIFPVMLNLGASALIANITSAAFDKSISYMMTVPSLHRAIALISTQLLVLYLTLLFQKYIIYI